MFFVGENFWAKVAKNFSGKFGEILIKIFAPPKICLLLHTYERYYNWDAVKVFCT